MPSLPFDLSRFRRIFDPVQQSQGGSHGGWETENPPLPPYPLNPPFAPNMQPPPMLQGPPEQPPVSLPQPPPEPMVGQPQRTPQTPLNPPRTSPNLPTPMTSSPRMDMEPPYQMKFPPVNPAQGMYEPRQPFSFSTEGWPIPEQYGAIEPPPKPSIQFPTSPQSRFPQPPQPMPSHEPYPDPFKPMRSSQDLYPERIDAPPDDEPIPGLSRGGGGTGLRRPDELRPGTITNENMGDVPDFPDWYNRPSLNMGPEYDAQPADIANQAQANTPDEWFGQEGPQMPQSEEEQINQAISQWKPETAMQERLNSLLNEFPQRDQNMSKWRKFGSFVVGAGLGPEAQERATYAPFYRQMGDWQAKLDPTLKGAELERQGNINLRQLLHNNAMERVAGQNANTREQGENRRYEQGNRALQIKERIATMNELQRKDRNWKYDVDKTTDTIWGYHPTQGKYDTGIKSYEVSAEQKHLWNMEEIKETGAQRRNNQRDRWSDYDAYPANGGPPIRMSRNLDTDEVIQLPGEAVGPRPTAQPPTQAPAQAPAQGGTAPPTQSPAPTQQPQVAPPQAPVQAPAQAPAAPVAPAYGKPQSDTDKQKGLETQVSRAKHKFPEYEEYINFDETTQLPDITKPKNDWMGFGSGWTPYTWEKYDEIGKFVFGSDFKREGGPTTTGGTRTTSRGTTVTRID